MIQIPDHPVIRRMERTGYPYPIQDIYAEDEETEDYSEGGDEDDICQ